MVLNNEGLLLALHVKHRLPGGLLWGTRLMDKPPAEALTVTIREGEIVANYTPEAFTISEHTSLIKDNS